MQIDIITRAELEAWKKEILEAISTISSNTPDHSQQWLRTKQVKKLLNISDGTLANWRVRGFLKPVKIDGIYLYKSSEIESLLNKK